MTKYLFLMLLIDRVNKAHTKAKVLIDVICGGWSCSMALRKAKIIAEDVKILNLYPSPEWIVYREIAIEHRAAKLITGEKLRKNRSRQIIGGITGGG